MQSTDVVVAGGGLIGLATAYSLQRQGLHVTVLDAGRMGREASWAGGGILWPLYPWRYPWPVQALAQTGRRLYPPLSEQLLDQTGIDPQFRACGLLMADYDEQANMRAWAKAEHEPIQVDARLPAADGSRTSAPALSGILAPDVAQIRNPLLCMALEAALRAGGANLQPHCRVTSVATMRGRFLGFHTMAGLYRADAGVVALGAWSEDLLAACNGPGIQPVKGQMLMFKGPPDRLAHIVLAEGEYAIPRADGRILVGSTIEHCGYDQSTNSQTRGELAARWINRLPFLADCPLERHWAGLRPASHDGVPYIGAMPGLDGLFVNTGHYRNGVAMAPASAQLLSRLILGERVDTDSYRLDR